MGCGCGGQKRELNRPELQRLQAPVPARPAMLQQSTVPVQLQPPTPSPTPPLPSPQQNVAQLAATPSPTVPPQAQPVPLPRSAPARIPPPRLAASTNADAVREALRKRREQALAGSIGNKTRQY